MKGVSIPVAASVFPGEQYQAPRNWAEQAYPNLIYFNEVDRGGHFAAWEQPQLFSRGGPSRIQVVSLADGVVKGEAILLALTGSAIVAGIIGALLAVPVTAVVWTSDTAWTETGRGARGVARARPTWSGS